jgi:hypothetical protein
LNTTKLHAGALKPHPLAAIFPEMRSEELNHLADDIRKRGQLEPIIVYRGLILDGQNRYKACKLAGIKPRTEEFEAKLAQRTPEEFVLSRNLRRRHLSGGQKATIALDWSERMEFSPKVEKTRGLGRPKGPIPDAAKQIGISEQRVFEVRQVRDASSVLYLEVKSGHRSLKSALDKIKPPAHQDERNHKRRPGHVLEPRTRVGESGPGRGSGGSREPKRTA